MPAGCNARHTSMVPSDRPPTAGATFPYIGLAVAVLALYAILAVTMPLNPYRAAVALVAFFAMGYCTLGLVAGGRIPMSVAEILAFTVGLTILITSLSALAVSIVGIPITEFAVVIIGLPIGVVAFLLRRPATGPVEALVAFAGRLFDFTDYSAGEKAVAIALFLAVIGALGVFISIAGVGYPDPHTAALGIDGPYGSGGMLDPVPYTFVRGAAHRIVVTVLGNATPGSFGVRIRLVPLNATGTEPFHSVPTTFPLALDEFAEHRDSITVAAEGRWTNSYSIAIDPVGNFTLRFDLLDSSNRTIAGVHLPIQTTDPPMVSASMAMMVGTDVRGSAVGSGVLRSGHDLID